MVRGSLLLACLRIAESFSASVPQVRELKAHEVRRVLDLGAQNNNPEINPYFSALPPGPEYRVRAPA